MDDFLNTTINGLSSGAIYALGAVGLSLVYGILKLVNFAHGDFMTLGGYINAVRAGNEFVGAAPRRCDAAARVRVSTVDRRYGVWTQDNRRAERIGGCVVGDGYIILRFQPNGRWRIRTQGSGGAPCSVTGVRIAKDLLPGLPCD